MEDKTSTVEENEGKRCEETDSAQTKDAVKFLFIRKNEKKKIDNASAVYIMTAEL